MKKYFLSFLIIGLFSVANAQNLFQAVSGEISFFSETPMENIDAKNETIKALLNIKNGDIAFIVTNVGFKFKKPLMEEHFNENYMESDKYKTSVFKGKLTGDDLDLTQNGTYNVKAKGTLNVHGVDKEREIIGVLKVKDGILELEGEFEIVLQDHKIKIPKVVIKNIAEVVNVKVNIKLEEKK